MTTDRSRETGPDLDALAAYARRGDREAALFFVGRNTEFAKVEQLCARSLAEARTGGSLAGATCLFQGAPGAGKSSLLAEIAERCQRAKQHNSGEWALPVLLTVPEQLESEEDVSLAVLRGADPDREEKYRGTGSRWMTGRVGDQKGSSVAPPILDFDELARIVSTGVQMRPVCLMVDEVQNVREAARRVLTRLHQGVAGLPVVPVLAGLGSSHGALQRCGLSRLSVDAVHDIGALAPEEAREAVERMFETCRVDRRGGNRDWPGWLADISEGWPQHLHNGMRALAEGLVDAGGRLAGVDAGRVAVTGNGFRETSCRARVSPPLRNAIFLVGTVLAALPDEGADSGAIIDELERVAATNGSKGTRWRLPRSMDGEAFFDHLVHRGVFQLGPTDLYSCPIPSLRDYLVRRGSPSEPDDVAR